jgi:ribosomal protein L7/L12
MHAHAVMFAVSFAVFGFFLGMMIRRGGIVQAGLDPNAPRTMDEVRRLAASNQMIAAIRLHREITGMGLKDSKDAVEAIARGAAAAVVPVSAPDASTDARILALVRQNQLIEAIKAHREAYGSGLAQAKDAIDRLKASL